MSVCACISVSLCSHFGVYVSVCVDESFLSVIEFAGVFLCKVMCE